IVHPYVCHNSCCHLLHLLSFPTRRSSDLEQSVLVELVPLLLSDLAELDVVCLGSREILQGGPVRRGLHGAQVHLQSAAQQYFTRSEEHTSELQSLRHLVCRLLLEKKNQSR